MFKKLKKNVNSVINFRRVTHFRLCLLETQVINNTETLVVYDSVPVLSRHVTHGNVSESVTVLSHHIAYIGVFESVYVLSNHVT